MLRVFVFWPKASLAKLALVASCSLRLRQTPQPPNGIFRHGLQTEKVVSTQRMKEMLQEREWGRVPGDGVGLCHSEAMPGMVRGFPRALPICVFKRRVRHWHRCGLGPGDSLVENGGLNWLWGNTPPHCRSDRNMRRHKSHPLLP